MAAKTKRTRCPKGTRKSPVTGNCTKRCPSGYRKNKTTKRCNKKK